MTAKSVLIRPGAHAPLAMPLAIVIPKCQQILNEANAIKHRRNQSKMTIIA